MDTYTASALLAAQLTKNQTVEQVAHTLAAVRREHRSAQTNSDARVAEANGVLAIWFGRGAERKATIVPPAFHALARQDPHYYLVCLTQAGVRQGMWHVSVAGPEQPTLCRVPGPLLVSGLRQAITHFTARVEGVTYNFYFREV